MSRRTRITAVGMLAVLPALFGVAKGVDGEEGNRKISVLRAQRFTVDEPYPHSWRSERPAVVKGYVLVLEVSPPLDCSGTLLPVLYADDVPVERLNFASCGYRVYALAPSDSDVYPDLWFGPASLPEQVAQEDAEAGLREAYETGNISAARDEVQRASADAAGVSFVDLEAANRVELLKLVARDALEVDRDAVNAEFLEEFIAAPTFVLPAVPEN